jgi:hypothetical protein
MAALRRRYIYNPEKWFNSSSGFSSIGKYENRKKIPFSLEIHNSANETDCYRQNSALFGQEDIFLKKEES